MWWIVVELICKDQWVTCICVSIEANITSIHRECFTFRAIVRNDILTYFLRREEMSVFSLQILRIILINNRRCMVVMMKWRQMVATIAIWIHHDYSSSWWLRLSWFEGSNHLCLWWWRQILRYLLKPWFGCKLIRNSSSYLYPRCSITRHHWQTCLTLLYVSRFSLTTLISRRRCLCQHIGRNLFSFLSVITTTPIDGSIIIVPK